MPFKVNSLMIFSCRYYRSLAFKWPIRKRAASFKKIKQGDKKLKQHINARLSKALTIRISSKVPNNVCFQNKQNENIRLLSPEPHLSSLDPQRSNIRMDSLLWRQT